MELFEQKFKTFISEEISSSSSHSEIVEFLLEDPKNILSFINEFYTGGDMPDILQNSKGQDLEEFIEMYIYGYNDSIDEETQEKIQSLYNDLPASKKLYIFIDAIKKSDFVDELSDFYFDDEDNTDFFSWIDSIK